VCIKTLEYGHIKVKSILLYDLALKQIAALNLNMVYCLRRVKEFTIQGDWFANTL